MGKRKPKCICGLPYPHLERQCLTDVERAQLAKSRKARGRRLKGGKGEREVIDLLQPVVDAAYRAASKDPPQLKRMSSTQADGGGCDVCGLEWLALEVKRCETLQLDAWWRQCLAQAKPGQMPVLVYRQNSRQWRARLYVQIAITYTTVVADLSIADFCTYFRDGLRVYLFERSSNASM